MILSNRVNPCTIKMFVCVWCLYTGRHTVYVHVSKSFRQQRRHRRRSSHKDKKEGLIEGVSDKSDKEHVDDSTTSIFKPLGESPDAKISNMHLGFQGLPQWNNNNNNFIRPGSSP